MAQIDIHSHAWHSFLLEAGKMKCDNQNEEEVAMRDAQYLLLIQRYGWTKDMVDAALQALVAPFKSVMNTINFG